MTSKYLHLVSSDHPPSRSEEFRRVQQAKRLLSTKQVTFKFIRAQLNRSSPRVTVVPDAVSFFAYLPEEIRKATSPLSNQ